MVYKHSYFKHPTPKTLPYLSGTARTVCHSYDKPRSLLPRHLVREREGELDIAPHDFLLATL